MAISTTQEHSPKQSAECSAGHAIIKSLQLHDIGRAYLVPGESFLDVLDGMYENSFQAVVCRHEGGAGFAALAEGRLTGCPGVAMVTRGPGAANAMIAVHTAWQDATPMLLFVGLIPIADRGREAFQEFNIEAWFGSTSKKVFVLDDPNQASTVVAEAVKLATTGRPGPVVIGLPEDILLQPCANLVAPISRAQTAPNAVDLKEFADYLSSAEKPLIIAGGDGWTQTASEQLAHLAHRLQVPVLCDWRAYDALPHGSAAYAGWIGYGRPESIVRAIAESDLHIFIGAGRSDVGSEGFTVGLGKKTILVLADSMQTMHAGRTDKHIYATPSSFLQEITEFLLPEPAQYSVSVEKRKEWFARLQQEYKVAAAKRADKPAAGVDLGLFFAELDVQLPRERVISYGAGNATIWGHRYLHHNVANSLVGPRNGAMGLAIPALLAAGYCMPERKAVAVCGDGDFLMNGQELFTAVAAGQKPLVIVVDNQRYGTIVQHQEREYPGRNSGTVLHNPDFAIFAAAAGAHTETVRDNSDLCGAITRALNSDKAALLHLIVDPQLMPSTL